MNRILSVAFAVSLSVSMAFGTDALPFKERQRLASYLAYVVSAVDQSALPSGPTVKVGDWCPDCTPNGKPLYPNKPGMVGDGSVFEKCGRCGGTQRIQPDDPDLGSAGSTCQEDSFQCQCCLEEAEQDALEESYELEEKQSQEEMTKLTPDILCFENSAWTFEDKRVREATNADMVSHLVEVHGLEFDAASKMSRDELIALHNLIHSSEVRSSKPSASSSSASCPSGGCPSGSGGSCPTCPSNSSRNTSSSRSYRGLFGRRR